MEERRKEGCLRKEHVIHVIFCKTIAKLSAEPGVRPHWWVSWANSLSKVRGRSQSRGWRAELRTAGQCFPPGRS